ncbi:MAG: molybdenum cofactor biosynthesis protein MoaE [Actinomycetota bacterium]|nr:molybdenum cofactor biosynthesis protein MoaE [Actinomycetota bacterium]
MTATADGPGPSGVVRLVAITDQPLSVDEVLAAVSAPTAGGIALFVGTIRAEDGGRDVEGLGYSAHPSAQEALAAVCATVAGRHEVIALAATHRVGDLVVGDLATVVAASSAHRADAFAAAKDLIDTLKSTVPIWKQQRFTDGGAEWVGLP